jgi:hypothetical protein
VGLLGAKAESTGTVNRQAQRWPARGRFGFARRRGGSFATCKVVHGDVHALPNAGMLHKTDDGRIMLPFDAFRVDVMLRAG